MTRWRGFHLELPATLRRNKQDTSSFSLGSTLCLNRPTGGRTQTILPNTHPHDLRRSSGLLLPTCRSSHRLRLRPLSPSPPRPYHRRCPPLLFPCLALAPCSWSGWFPRSLRSATENMQPMFGERRVKYSAQSGGGEDEFKASNTCQRSYLCCILHKPRLVGSAKGDRKNKEQQLRENDVLGAKQTPNKTTGSATSSKARRETNHEAKQREPGCCPVIDPMSAGGRPRAPTPTQFIPHSSFLPAA